MKKILLLCLLLFSLNNAVIANQNSINEIPKVPNKNILNASMQKYDILDVLENSSKENLYLKQKYKTNKNISKNLALIPWINNDKLLFDINDKRKNRPAFIHDGIDYTTDSIVNIKNTHQYTSVSYWDNIKKDAKLPTYTIIVMHSPHSEMYLYDNSKSLKVYSYDGQTHLLDNNNENLLNIFKKFQNCMKYITDTELAREITNYQQVCDIINDTLYKKLNYKPKGLDIDKSIALSSFYKQPIINENAPILAYNYLHPDAYPNYASSPAKAYLALHPNIFSIRSKYYYSTYIYKFHNHIVNKHIYNVLNDPNLTETDKFFYLFIYENYPSTRLSETDNYYDKIKIYNILKSHPEIFAINPTIDVNTQIIFLLQENAHQLLTCLTNDSIPYSNKINMYFASEYPNNKKLQRLAEEKVLDKIDITKINRFVNKVMYEDIDEQICIDLINYGYADFCVSQIEFLKTIDSNKLSSMFKSTRGVTDKERYIKTINRFYFEFCKSKGQKFHPIGTLYNDSYPKEFARLLKVIDGKLSPHNVKFIAELPFTNPSDYSCKILKNQDIQSLSIDEYINNVNIIVNNKNLTESEKISQIFKYVKDNNTQTKQETYNNFGGTEAEILKIVQNPTISKEDRPIFIYAIADKNYGTGKAKDNLGYKIKLLKPDKKLYMKYSKNKMYNGNTAIMLHDKFRNQTIDRKLLLEKIFIVFYLPYYLIRALGPYDITY